ncbi:MAG TPA: phosphoenolpyruvate--protein phosphotransferase [Gemmataceae bacterium]|nr:phosphoenolpyruvate--protein phosphotransferase [Gemmataceae bacterium]
MIQGVAVSPGVAVARAYCLNQALARREPIHISPEALSAEVTRFDAACAAAARELDGIARRVTQQVGEDEAAIFRAHQLLLRDPAFVGKVRTAVMEKHIDAAAAVQQIVEEYKALFSHITDKYIQERIADLRDVGARILTELARQDNRPLLDVTEPVILTAPEILPSQALNFDRKLVAGILTERGAATGHAAILARSLNIPAVSGLEGLTHQVKTGDLIALDGREGHVHINPGPEVVAAYRKLQREYVDLVGRLIGNAELPAVSACGIPVELLANVNGVNDAAMAGKVGAAGVGLYRTEYLFLAHPSVPDEEEQFQAYRSVIASAPQRTVTIRTIDLGADKAVPYFGREGEANPFMGFRSIRLSYAYPEFFRTQMRAILRAAVEGKVELLFPMVSTLEEVRDIRRMVEATRTELRRSGTRFSEDVPLGVMIEVPAAALCIDEIVREVDFVSIGSNDLVQYLMAADRDNPKVAHLCEPFSPALLRLLNHVIRACHTHGKPVTLCGEMAGRARCVLPLFGMGLRRVSMSPAFVPSIRELVRHTTLEAAKEAAHAVLHMATVHEVRTYLTAKVREIWPEMRLLDVRE